MEKKTHTRSTRDEKKAFEGKKEERRRRRRTQCLSNRTENKPVEFNKNVVGFSQTAAMSKGIYAF